MLTMRLQEADTPIVVKLMDNAQIEAGFYAAAEVNGHLHIWECDDFEANETTSWQD
jgi:hypothetical protein